ncbi:ADP-ribosylation factor-like protein [Legionella londiniensis]|uniref:Rho GTPase (Miro-like) n=1 Tax=Legionella londiniensis TaxID=45068 RepID=A0A0W0VMP4_9GAMM|nr:ADP-ribosylation factor-like protein [Legionella londiniensis]KTD21368.1 Rho GTPase (Miro-like) [Legionella londiniensis]STX93576.1 Rho GTPase (Miro-like) [Legionella londiniensis]
MSGALNCYFWGAGTTSLTHRLAGKEFHEPKPTVGVDFDFIETGSRRLGLWDTSSNPRFEPIIRVYAQNANIGIYCVDLSKEIDEQKIKEEIEWFRQSNKDQAQILVVGTKHDLSLESNEDLQQVINKLFTKPSERPAVFITSAKTGQGIEEFKKDLISGEALYKEIEKPAQKLIHALAKMRDYGNKLAQEGVDKSKTILTLHKKLCERLGLEAHGLDGSPSEIKAIKNAFKNERDIQLFQNQFKEMLHSEDGSMSRHRKVWKPIVANIMLALTGVGAAIMAARAAGHLVHSLATRKSPSLRATFFFTDTNSMKNINSVEEALDDLVKKGPNK